MSGSKGVWVGNWLVHYGCFAQSVGPMRAKSVQELKAVHLLQTTK